MTDPKIVSATVRLKYKADDKYSYQWDAKAPLKDFPKATPEKVLLDSFQEFARICLLFYGDEAVERFNISKTNIDKWRANRKEGV